MSESDSNDSLSNFNRNTRNIDMEDESELPPGTALRRKSKLSMGMANLGNPFNNSLGNGTA